MDKVNELQVIKEQEVLGKQFRIYGDKENPLFLAKDVAEWVDHSNQRMMLKSIDENEKICVNNPYALKGQKEQWFLTEDGLYEVLMQSRKPIAKQFKKEVKQILKTIRKHEVYMTPKMIEEVLYNPDTIIKIATALKEEQTKNKELKEVNAKLYLNNEIMKPKAEQFDRYIDSEGLIGLNQVAKAIGTGRNTMMEFLLINHQLLMLLLKV